MEQVPTMVYTPEEVAACLRIGRNKCYDLIRAGQIRALHLGRTYRIPHQEMTRLLESAGLPNDAPPSVPARPVQSPTPARLSRRGA